MTTATLPTIEDLPVLEFADDSPSTSPTPLPADPATRKLLGLIDLILKNRVTLERVIREPSWQAELMPRLLLISVASFSLFGFALSLVFSSAGVWPELSAIRDWLQGSAAEVIRFEALDGIKRLTVWRNGSALTLIGAYTLGLIAATGICLPSLYFYGLLAGVRMTMRDVAIQSLKAKATAALALVGILPIYAAFAMGLIIFGAPSGMLRMAWFVGLILPFIAGLFGTRSLYVGCAGWCDTLPANRQYRRQCFLRRLVLSWAACYTAVTPVMIHSLWEFLSRSPSH